MAWGCCGCLLLAPPRRAAVDPATLPPDAHVVQPGESLSTIARRYQVEARDISRHNQLGNTPLRVGQVLRVPSAVSVAAAPPPVALPFAAAVVSPPVAAAVPSTAGAVSSHPVSMERPVEVPRLLKPELPPVVLKPPTWSPGNVVVAGLSSTVLPAEETGSLAEVLQNTLVEVGYFRVRSGFDMEAITREQAFQKDLACDDPAYLVEMGKLLATREILGGSIGRVGSTYTVSVRMVDVETGQVIISEQTVMAVEKDALIDLVRHTGMKLMEKYQATRQ